MMTMILLLSVLFAVPPVQVALPRVTVTEASWEYTIDPLWPVSGWTWETDYIAKPGEPPQAGQFNKVSQIGELYTVPGLKWSLPIGTQIRFCALFAGGNGKACSPWLVVGIGKAPRAIKIIYELEIPQSE